MNTDKTWQWFGLHDPYYGVLTSEEFRGGAHRERFWQTGREHVDRLLRCLRGAGDLTGRDRVSPADDESGWRRAA